MLPRLENQQRYESQRLAEGERQNNRSGPGLVDAHELHDLVRIGLNLFKHAKWRPDCLSAVLTCLNYEPRNHMTACQYPFFAISHHDMAMAVA